MTNRTIETMLGEDLFTYEEWKRLSRGEAEYYKVEFPFESMKKYNGGRVIKYDNGALRVYGKEIWKGYITDIPEFRELLITRLKKEKLTSLYNVWRDAHKHLVENYSHGIINVYDKELRKNFSTYAKLKEIISVEVMSELEDQYPDYFNRTLEKAESEAMYYKL